MLVIYLALYAGALSSEKKTVEKRVLQRQSLDWALGTNFFVAASSSLFHFRNNAYPQGMHY
jgi:hypothetical protein